MIIPARDAAEHLERALAALARLETACEYEVLVVDDGSGDATPDVARAAGGRVRLIAGEGRGPAHARNLAAAEARGHVLAFTDADCMPDPGWLDAGLRAIGAGADLVQGRVTAPPGVPQGPWDRMIWVEREYGLYETANLFVRRDLFERLGGFESILRPRNGKELGEDVWLGWRARRAGVRTAFATDALVHHAVLPRRARAYVSERARLVYFPELVRRIPELRAAFLYRRVFLNARTAKLDLAVAGLLAALLTRRPWPLLCALPYAGAVRAHARASDGPAAPVAAAEVAADLVGAVALAAGSLRSRTPVL